MIHHTYWRSTAAYRVRIALHLKGVAHESAYVHLSRDGGEQKQAAYRAKNPQGLIPALEVGDTVFGQSLAILEYLEETHPEPPLLPKDPVEGGRVRALANLIACDMHPLNNLRVQIYLRREIGCSQEQVLAWYRHWVAEGFGGTEPELARTAGDCCFGDTITMADLCLIPQVFNARRFGCDLSAYPTIVAIDARLAAHPAFAAAEPLAQGDAEPDNDPG